MQPSPLSNSWTFSSPQKKPAPISSCSHFPSPFPVSRFYRPLICFLFFFFRPCCAWHAGSISEELFDGDTPLFPWVRGILAAREGSTCWGERRHESLPNEDPRRPGKVTCTCSCGDPEPALDPPALQGKPALAPPSSRLWPTPSTCSPRPRTFLPLPCYFCSVFAFLIFTFLNFYFFIICDAFSFRP